MEINYIVIPLIVALVAVRGVRFTRQGLRPWYAGLKKPNWTPSGTLIREIWIFIYLLTGFAVLWYWNVPVFGTMHYVVGGILLVNAYMNSEWNKIFFVQQNIAKAYRYMIMMNATTVLATIIIFTQSRIAALFFLPYIIWVAIATKLTKQLWVLNRR